MQLVLKRIQPQGDRQSLVSADKEEGNDVVGEKEIS